MNNIQLSPAIAYRGKEFRAKKKFFDGTHRSLSPAETYEKIQPYEKIIGLTRNANITGLDRLGVHVTAAIRPNSLTLATSSGKGLSLESAVVSGVMEAMELHHAETTGFHPVLLPYNELIQEYATIPLEHLPLRKHAFFQTDWQERWIFGWDLFSHREVAVPMATVCMDYRRLSSGKRDMMSFECSSNGLAAGNHFLEALAAGLYEVIERDAVSCHEFAGHEREFELPRVRLDLMPFPVVRELLDRFQQTGMRVLLYDCTLDTQIPVFKALIFDEQHPNLGLCGGYGAHLDPQVAMLRALTEAAQGHTILIAGARDDMFSQGLSHLKQYDARPEVEALSLNQPRSDPTGIPNRCGSTFEEDVHTILDSLKAAGLKQVIVLDLTQPEFDISVLKVIVPGLEGYHDRMYRPGMRARKFCEKLERKKGREFHSAPFHQMAGRGV